MPTPLQETPIPPSKLQVGLLINSFQLHAWQHALVNTLLTAAYAEVRIVVLLEERIRTRRGPGQWLHDAYEFLEMLGAREPHALAARDASELLEGVPAIRPGTRDPQAGSNPSGHTALREHGLHVLVNLCSLTLRDDWCGLAEYGVWSPAYGNEYATSSEAPGFWEVHARCPVTACGVRIEVIDKDGPRTVVFRSVCRTNPFSVALTNNAMYWKLASLLPRKLEELHRVGAFRCVSEPAPETRRHPPLHCFPSGRPREARLAWHVVLSVRRRMTDLIVRAVTMRPWILLFHLSDALSTDAGRFRKIVAPKDRYWADPFVVKHGDNYYVFVEEVMNTTGKGHIAVLVLDSSGRFDGPDTVLQRDYHLSYPFVFEHEGSWYMIPESSDDRTVQLYRCAEFPHKWEFVRHLLEDICAMDSTLLWHDGKWWLFANVVEHTGASGWEDLFLFHSDSLTGEWTSHPRNPIVSDVRGARPAGAIFRRDGHLYRPSQDCSVTYGYAIKLNRITTLSDEDYAEVEEGAITPDWDKKIRGTHTINHVGGMTVIDALQPRLRL